MAEDFAELGLESFNKLTDKAFDRTYDKINDKRKRMSGNARYGSQPPAHRGYDDDQDNEDDDEEPREPRTYGSGRERDRYNDRPRSAYDESRYVNVCTMVGSMMSTS
ncbi:hypothetical protein BDV97DRAFT_46882 [Delphinella strobiligena]|nr:hypothetical protein BDV97DRAFT_46882 [Delphinella strobiligena]